MIQNTGMMGMTGRSASSMAAALVMMYVVTLALLPFQAVMGQTGQNSNARIVDCIIRALPSHFKPQAAGGAAEVIHVTVNGLGVYTLTVTNGQASAVTGAQGVPTGTVAFDSPDTVVGLATGQISPMGAYFGGKISGSSTSLLQNFSSYFDMKAAAAQVLNDPAGAIAALGSGSSAQVSAQGPPLSTLGVQPGLSLPPAVNPVQPAAITQFGVPTVNSASLSGPPPFTTSGSTGLAGAFNGLVTAIGDLFSNLLSALFGKISGSLQTVAGAFQGMLFKAGSQVTQPAPTQTLMGKPKAPKAKSALDLLDTAGSGGAAAAVQGGNSVSSQPPAASAGKSERQTSTFTPFTGVVIAKSGLSVRNGAWGSRIGLLSYESTVTVTGREGVWYTHDYSGRKGYSHSSYIRRGAPGGGLQDPNSKPEESWNGFVTAGSLNVRNSPWGTKVGELSRGDEVKVTGSAGDWLRIAQGGETKYVHGSYVSRSRPSQDAAQTGSGPDLGKEMAKTFSVAGMNIYQAGFILAIGMTETGLREAEAYSERYNKASNNANVRKYGSAGADHGYFQNNGLQVREAVRKGIPEDIARHLNGGGQAGRGVSTLADQMEAMHHYFLKTDPNYKNFNNAGQFETFRQKWDGKWFGLKDQPSLARNTFDKFVKSNGNLDSLGVKNLSKDLLGKGFGSVPARQRSAGDVVVWDPGHVGVTAAEGGRAISNSSSLSKVVEHSDRAGRIKFVLRPPSE